MGEHKNFEYYRQSSDVTLKSLHASEQGLSKREAAERLELHGPNAFEHAKHQPLILRYLRQYADPMIALLIFSAALAFYLGDAKTGAVLVALTLLNTFIGFGQEFKADRALSALTKLVVPKARVLRDGHIEEIDSSELTIGDIVELEEGVSVPADLRLISEEGFRTNDFALTGESNPSRKFTHAISAKVPLAERHNLAFMGTTVATGTARGVVIAVGTGTELGHIVSLSKDTKSETSPLQKELGHIAKRVTQGVVLLSLVTLPLALYADLAIKDALLFAIAIGAAVIPQGLPAEINTALATAASKLARSGALAKKLSAVETLGATTAILTDKTGTRTENQMTIEQFFIGNDTYTVTGTGYKPDGSIRTQRGRTLDAGDLRDLELFFSAGAFSSNAHVSPPDDEHADYYAIGDPTEAALITLAAKAGYGQADLDRAHPELREFAFDSGRKRMSSVRAFGSSSQPYVFVKGAPENVLEKATHIWIHGHARALTAADRKRIIDTATQQAEGAMRNLGLAYRVLPKSTKLGDLTMDSTEEKLIWLGMVSMIDPLRASVPHAMRDAHRAHIKVSVITGDHAVTAKAIAERAGLAPGKQEIVVVTGDELEDIDDARIKQLVSRGGVIFSRVAPRDKLRIVKLAQVAGNVVAVTGDGVNDAPALKRADIGVAMGVAGTDVAKESAEIILTDDSFGTLVKAIQQGRTIFANIRKATLACFTSNAAELVITLTSLVATALFHIPLALSVMQILAIDLIAELFPVAALGQDKAEGNIMRDKPRRLRDHILNRRSITDLAWCGLLIGGLAFANFLIFFQRNNADPSIIPSGTPIHMEAMAMAYLTIVLCQLANILIRRSEKGLFTRYQFHNKYLWIAIAFSLVAVCAIIYVPFIAGYFQTGPLGFDDWLYALLATAIFITIRQFQIYDKRNHRKHVHSLNLAQHLAKLTK